MQKSIKKNQNRVIKLTIDDSFWAKKIEMISKEIIPYQWEILNDNIPDIEPSHAIENFRIAAGEIHKDFYGMKFQDSDVAKWIEAASYSLSLYPDPEIEKNIDYVVDIIEKAQQPDGYINTYFTIAKPDKKWTDFTSGHELYCAGHLIEAAIAYYQATSKDKFLSIVRRFADHIDSLFGSAKMKKFPGHEEIELALIKLYRVTGEKRYLNLSNFFIEERGKQLDFLKDNLSFGNNKISKWFDLEYYQAHAPVREQTKVTGHAVRAMYLYSAMADLVMETNDESLFASLEILWDNMTNQRMYITGGLGSEGYAERFTFDFDLPNDTAHAETCASIGLLFWAHRMLMIEKNRKYADVFEKALYNGCLSGISWNGKAYFYSNPLEVFPEAVNKRHDLSHINHHRLPWYACACCPPNIARLLTSLDTYIVSTSENYLYVHQYMNSRIRLEMGKRNINIIQETNYPWDGKVTIKIDSECGENFTIALRIPGWCSTYTYSINGQKPDRNELINGYLLLKSNWKKDDTIELNLKMDIQLLQSHPKVRENNGRVAIQRGPLIYCLEETDNGSNLPDISLTSDSSLKTEFDPDFFDGMVLIKGTGLRTDETSWENTLYRPYQPDTKKVNITAVPYFTWANRKPGEMLVWIKYNHS